MWDSVCEPMSFTLWDIYEPISLENGVLIITFRLKSVVSFKQILPSFKVTVTWSSSNFWDGQLHTGRWLWRSPVCMHCLSSCLLVCRSTWTNERHHKENWHFEPPWVSARASNGKRCTDIFRWPRISFWFIILTVVMLSTQAVLQIHVCLIRKLLSTDANKGQSQKYYLEFVSSTAEIQVLLLSYHKYEGRDDLSCPWPDSDLQSIFWCWKNFTFFIDGCSITWFTSWQSCYQLYSELYAYKPCCSSAVCYQHTN